MAKAWDRVAAVLNSSRAAGSVLGRALRETLDLHGRDDAVDQALDRGERLTLIVADEQVGNAVLAHASGSADPMDVVFRIVGHIVIDDVADALDIDTATDDVGGDEHGNLPAAKPLHDTIARGLGKIAMDGGNSTDHPVQPVGEAVGPALGAGEDDTLPRPVALEQKKQQVEFLIGVHRDVELLDRVDRWLIVEKG